VQTKLNNLIFRHKTAAAHLIVSAAVIFYVCILLVLYHESSQELQANYLERYKSETEKKAFLVENFFSERKDDLKNLSQSREIGVYFENRALGMSPEYGLNLSLPAIAEHFQDLLLHKNYYNNRIYTRIALLDKRGAILVDTGPETPPLKNLKSYLSPGYRDDAYVLVKNGDIGVSIAYYFKGRYEAQLVAWIDGDVVFKQFMSDVSSDKDRVWLLLKNTTPPTPLTAKSAGAPDFLKPGFASKTSWPEWAKPVQFEEALKDGGRREWIGLAIPVQGTDFLYVRETQKTDVLGRVSPRMQLLGMISLAVLILGIGIFNILLNIKTQKLKERLEESLHNEVDIYKTLSEKSFTGVFVIQGGVFRYITQNAAATFGYDMDSLIGMKHESIVLPEDQAQFSAMSEEMIGGGRKTPYEFRILTQNHEIRWIMETTSPITFGARPAILGNCIDVTEKRQKDVLELHAIKLQSIGQLAAGIAHEINTPIQFVMDNIYFMKSSFEEMLELIGMLGEVNADNLSDVSFLRGLCARVHAKREAMDIDFLRDEIPQAIQQSMDGLDRVTKIVMAMREFSHPGGEEKKDIDINQSVESTITLTRNVWKHTADMATDLAADLPLVKGYSTDFNQVLLNMIVNASQSIEEKIGADQGVKGLIEISTRAREHFVEICIRDSGTGIPEEAQARIFDPFFTTKEVGKGTGQGLTLAHHIVVNKHGGNIRFETKPGEGTAFYIELPLSE